MDSYNDCVKPGSSRLRRFGGVRVDYELGKAVARRRLRAYMISERLNNLVLANLEARRIARPFVTCKYSLLEEAMSIQTSSTYSVSIWTPAWSNAGLKG